MAAKPKKKSWFEITAPAMFSTQKVGEIFLADAKQAIGRSMKINLMSLTNDPKRQNISMSLKIEDYRDGKLTTSVIGYNTSPSSIKRLVRRGRDRVDNSFTCTTKDAYKIRVKPLLITTTNTNQPVLSVLRKNAEALFKEYAIKTDYDTILNEMISHKIQSQLKRQLKKIQPLRVCEIRQLLIEVAGESKPATKIDTDAPEIKTQEPKEVAGDSKPAIKIDTEVKTEKPKEVPKVNKPEIKKEESQG